MAIKKIRLRPESTNNYADTLHPETSPEAIVPGTFKGIVKAKSNTEHNVAQLRNIILSTEDAQLELMKPGEVWIKYE